MHIDTDSFSKHLRSRIIRHQDRSLLIARLPHSDMAKDRYTRINCSGFGRVRVFNTYSLHMEALANHAPRPLLRGHPPMFPLRTQVFQLAACNWRCWYCYVDDDRLSADTDVAEFLSCDQLVDMFAQEPDRPDVVDLSGGQPDLAPEWNLWMMQALERRGLRGQVFLWTDDNLSNRYFWDYLTDDNRAYMSEFPLYSRVGCFKGFDECSFTFNTGADPERFAAQFDIFQDLLRAKFAMYAYATFTTPTIQDLDHQMKRFVDRLQRIHPNLPLRTIPLRIHPFTATQMRSTALHGEATQNQIFAFHAWETELAKRFSTVELTKPFDEVDLGN